MNAHAGIVARMQKREDLADSASRRLTVIGCNGIAMACGIVTPINCSSDLDATAAEMFALAAE